MSRHTQSTPRGARRVARSRVVHTDAATLYAALANPHRHHELDGSGTVSPVVTGPSRLALGDEFTVGMRLGPINYRMRNRVTALEPNRLIEWSLPVGHRWRWELEPLPDGGTRVTEVFDFSRVRLAWLMRALGFPKRNGLGIERTLAHLDANLGAHARPAPEHRDATPPSEHRS